MILRMASRFFVLFASVRVARLCRTLPLDQLVERIRQVPVLPMVLRNPVEFQTLVNRWYHRLPPQGFRPCMKRAYLLLDLWARCGLKPEFHIGIRTVDGVKEGHAWLEVEELAGVKWDSSGYKDAFVA